MADSNALGFIFSRSRVLENTRRGGQLFYNRVTLLDKSDNFIRSRCWVHESTSEICDFDEKVNCACTPHHPHSASSTCPQLEYITAKVSPIYSDDDDDALVLVDFGLCRCLAVVANDGVYLFSTIGRCCCTCCCGAGGNADAGNGTRGGVCQGCASCSCRFGSSCTNVKATHDSRQSVQHSTCNGAAVRNLDTCAASVGGSGGLPTFSAANACDGDADVTDSTPLIHANDSIRLSSTLARNGTSCTCPVTAMSSGCSMSIPCVDCRRQVNCLGCGSCNTNNDDACVSRLQLLRRNVHAPGDECCTLTLLEYFAIETNVFDALEKAQEVAFSVARLEGILPSVSSSECTEFTSNLGPSDFARTSQCQLPSLYQAPHSYIPGKLTDGMNLAQKLLNGKDVYADAWAKGASSIPLACSQVATDVECEFSGDFKEPNRMHFDFCNANGVQARHKSRTETKAETNGLPASPRSLNGASSNIRLVMDADDELDKYAMELIARCKRELVAQCSSLIGQLNSYCQAPLIIHMRWLRHCAILEYLVEYSPDLSRCYFDEYSQKFVPDVTSETRVLHEMVQVSILTRESIEGLFHYCIRRLDDYLALRTACQSAQNAIVDSGAADSVNTVQLSDSPNPGEDITDGEDSRERAAALNVEQVGVAANSSRASDNELSDVSPAWWNCYNNTNTYGESDGSVSGSAGIPNDSGKRLTRSQFLKLQDDSLNARNNNNNNNVNGNGNGMILDDIHTPIAKKQRAVKKSNGSSGNNNNNNNKTPCASDRMTFGAEPLSIVPLDRGRRASAVCYCTKCIAPVCNLSRNFEVVVPSILSSVVVGAAKVTDCDPITKIPPQVVECPSLKSSILAALEAGNALSSSLSQGESQCIDVYLKRLNTALLSTFRLGEVLLNKNGARGIGSVAHGEFAETIYEAVNAHGGHEFIPVELGEMLLTNRLLYAGLEEYMTFENDLYCQEELISDTEQPQSASSGGIATTTTNKSKRRRASAANHHHHSSDGHLQQPHHTGSTRTRRREVWKDYVYENLTSDVEEWYEDSDASSKKSNRSAHRKSSGANRQSQTNLSEIYGDQDVLIPMGPLPIGVYFDASRKLWRCQWRESGKFKTKGFSLHHYKTLSNARHACIVFRCQVGNIDVQPEWLTPTFIHVSELANRKAHAQQQSANASGGTPKKSKRKRPCVNHNSGTSAAPSPASTTTIAAAPASNTSTTSSSETLAPAKVCPSPTSISAASTSANSTPNGTAGKSMVQVQTA